LEYENEFKEVFQLMINTVLGPISPDNLGQTLVHEHFVCGQGGWFADASVAPYKRSAALKVNLDVCRDALASGIKTIVDCTTCDFPRDPLLYKQLADKTGINIICVTGLFNEEMGCPAYWKVRVKFFKKDISKYIAELFIKEIAEGIGKSGIKAGAIKIATDEHITPYEESMFRGAVIAQKETGVPIITHCEGPEIGTAQLDLLLSLGADMKKVLIGHVSNSNNFNYQKNIAEKAYVGFDRLGFALFAQDQTCISHIAELCKQGLANKVLMSHDTVNFWAGRSVINEAPPELVSLMADWKVDHISKRIIPALKAKGVSDSQVRQIMVDNPRNLFTGK
jgi:phosphotriesterase-related protein